MGICITPHTRTHTHTYAARDFELTFPAFQGTLEGLISLCCIPMIPKPTRVFLNPRSDFPLIQTQHAVCRNHFTFLLHSAPTSLRGNNQGFFSPSHFSLNNKPFLIQLGGLNVRGMISRPLGQMREYAGHLFRQSILDFSPSSCACSL